MKGILTNSTISLTAFESFHSFALHPTVPHDVRMLSHTRKLQLADPKNESEVLPIEIFIGGDNYWKIVKDSSPIRLTSSVVLLPSKLGWILSGSRSGITVNSVMVNYVKLNTSSPSEDILRHFWDLETIGIMENQDRTPSLKDSALLQEFAASFCLEDQRRVVSFPRKANITVPNNRHEAEKRFLSLEKKLEQNGLSETDLPNSDVGSH
jgi:hypothetical protein